MVLRVTYPDKTNDPSDPDLVRRFYAEEANELKNVADNHADEIEDLKAALPSTNNPFYGIYSSIILLQVAHPMGVLNAYAIIDAGYGLSQQLVVWNVDDEIWELATAVTDKIFVANQAALPGPGTENVWYITLDKNEMYLWFNSQYNLMNSPSGSQSTSPIIVIATAGQTEILLPTKPASVLVFKDSAKQVEHEDRDITYNSGTGAIALLIPAEGGEFFEIFPFGASIRTAQTIIATSNGQATFNFSGNPATLNVYLEGYKLRPSDFTRTYYSTGNSFTITNPDVLEMILTDSIIELDKF